jgi:hypothetical protein
MQKQIYFPPIHATSKFHCPHCGVFAEQRWAAIVASRNCYAASTIYQQVKFEGSFGIEWSTSRCEHCDKKVIWHEDSMIFPKQIIVEQPNPDLDADIQKDYLEAANIFNDSPRASAALLRLALQKLCKQLGEKGDNINHDIGKLVKKGLNPTIQKAMDSLRITGNNGVHPGEINLNEVPDKVLQLFKIINFIAEKMISEPRELENFYEALPDDDKNAISKRDKKGKENE